MAQVHVARLRNRTRISNLADEEVREMEQSSDKLRQLELENENLRLNLQIMKESNKEDWQSWIWVLVPVVGMVVGAIYKAL